MRLTILSFVFFITSLVFSRVFSAQINKTENAQGQQMTAVLAQEDSKTPTPKIIENLPFNVTATSIYVVRADSNEPQVVFQKNSDLLVPPASTTKIVTALTAIDYFSSNDILTVPKLKIEGQKMGLFWGEKISFESLLYGLLVDSANDASETIAQNFPLGRETFIQKMNEKVRSLGLPNTSLSNPSGLSSANHVSTAKEMAILGSELMKNNVLREIVSTNNAAVFSADLKSVHKFSSTNLLLSKVPGVLGIKTGWTEEAHENLVTYVSRQNKNYIISIFGSDDRFGETEKIINWLYENNI